MSIIKNKLQNNFTMISNTILKDKELSMNSFLNFPQREDYDFEELERKLVKNY